MLSCLFVGLWQLLIHSAHKVRSVKLNVMHQCAALLWIADSRGMLKDEQRYAGFVWSPCCCNSNLADLDLPAKNLFSMEIKFTQQDSSLLYYLFPGATIFKDPRTKFKYLLCRKNGTFAHKMMDGRKANCTRGESLSHFDNWIICLLELFYTLFTCACFSYMTGLFLGF